MQFKSRQSGLCRVFLVLLVAGCWPQSVGRAAPAGILPIRFENALWSPDGQRLAVSGENNRGMYLFEPARGRCLMLTDAAGSGYACHFSADGKRLAFKLLIPRSGGGFPLQQPVVFDLDKQALAALCAPVARAGVPSFSADGTLAYTVDRELRVIDPAGNVRRYQLDHYANLAPISPDGRRVAFNNADDAICILDLAGGERTVLTPPGLACHGPAWSPDSTRIVVNTVSGKLMSAEVGSKEVHDLGEGSSPSWMPDSRTIVYAVDRRQESVRLVDSDLFSVRCDGSAKTPLTSAPGRLESSPSVSRDGGRLVYLDLGDGRIYQADLDSSFTSSQAPRLERAASLIPDAVEVQTMIDPAATPLALVEAAVPGQVRLSRTCPYVHQVYDTPNAFNGHWACGATSAIMAIQYYEILPVWNVTVSVPYTHVSPFGQYVSEIYTYNGHTYNIGSPDPNGRLGYGGYGYIVRNDWADTKGYMRDYFINHGLGSSVDWSPTWNELKAEIDADHPFVLLNSLTTAGHYITTIGYFENQMTAVFNDPYGNKNTPGYPSYDGAGACYDWPGYNNGYETLKKVHCFIYARGGWPPTIGTHPADVLAGRGATAHFDVEATGLAPISYRWQKDGSALSDGGHYSGATTSTLTITGVDAADVAWYRCVVSNTYGSVTSEQAELRISSPDFDGDGDVDLEDFGRLQACLSSPGEQTSPDCRDSDLDGDDDVDAADLVLFRPCFAGPGVSPPPGCL